MGRFDECARRRPGSTSRGPNLAGGSIFDDFNGDGLPDLFTTSLDADLGASLYINRGDGTFEDRSASAGLGDQVYALNVTRADFDNDGDLDVLLLARRLGDAAAAVAAAEQGRRRFRRRDGRQPAWPSRSRPSRPPGATTTMTGWSTCSSAASTCRPAVRRRQARATPATAAGCITTRANGTFKNVAAAAGVTNERCAKGSAWGDYDGDGRLDLFVSNMGQPCRLYHNEGDGKFEDVAPELGVTGRGLQLRLLVLGLRQRRPARPLRQRLPGQASPRCCASAMGVKIEGSSRPRLYRNLGPAGFRDVSEEVGLDRAMAPMGANFGDVDNDGYLDIYLGTGDMSYEGLDVNLMFRNVEGQRLRGRDHAVRHRPPSEGARRLVRRLGRRRRPRPVRRAGRRDARRSGRTTPCSRTPARAATGSRSSWSAPGPTARPSGPRSGSTSSRPDGQTRSIHRTIGNNSSFGGNSLVEMIGLLDATRVGELTVSWPTSRTTQTFRDVAADQTIEITEGSNSFKVLHQPASPSPHP